MAKDPRETLNNLKTPKDCQVFADNCNRNGRKDLAEEAIQKQIHLIAQKGESIVNTCLSKSLDSGSYFLLSDMTFQTKNNSTTQIDHIVISFYGIFIIETKHYKGFIFASESSKIWTQTLNAFTKTKFHNPIHQNYGHIQALSEILNLDDSYFHSLVVFSGDASFKKGIPSGVFVNSDYIKYIQLQETHVLSESQVFKIALKLESSALEKGYETSKLHGENIKKSITRHLKQGLT